MIVVVGGGSIRDIVKESYNTQLEKELAQLFTSSRSHYDEHWNIDAKMIREEKVKKAQSYKKKNQDHPAFRK